MSIFKINNTDYSARIKSGTYDINENDVYNEWTDANGIPHRDILRQRIEGSFDMLFRSKQEYVDFVDTIKNNKVTAGYVPCTIAVNNTNSMVQGNFYISYAPKRYLAGNGQQMMDMFTVTIVERNRNA